MLTIGKLASLAGTSTNTLRYDEREGLLAAAAKGANGCRHFPPQTMQTVLFIRRARQCGFSLDEIRRLQAMPARTCACRADVRQLAIAKRQSLAVQIESADIIMLSNRLDALTVARDISRRSYAKMVQSVTLAFLFNGIGIPLAATGLIHPIWAMTAMAVSVTAIFVNSLWGRPALFIDAVLSLDRPTTLPAGARA